MFENISLNYALYRCFLAATILLCSACSQANPSHSSARIFTANNLQGIYYDSHENLYSLEHLKDNPAGLIYLNNGSKRVLILKDENIGHQGFGIYNNQDGSINIWTSQKKAPLNALVFKQKNGVTIDKRSVKLFPEGYVVHNETMPTLSSDGKLLITRGRKSNNEMVIRVFDITVVYNEVYDHNNNDISNKYKYEWTTSSKSLVSSAGTPQPLQAIASNSKSISLLYGNARLNPKSIYTYSLNGKLLNINNNVIDGLTDAEFYEEQNFYEPEGLSYAKSSNMMILISYAKGKNKRNIVYNHQN